jgi:hypothetical protein
MRCSASWILYSMRPNASDLCDVVSRRLFSLHHVSKMERKEISSTSIAPVPVEGWETAGTERAGGRALVRREEPEEGFPMRPCLGCEFLLDETARVWE